MSMFTARRGGAGQHAVFVGRGVVTAGRTRMVGFAVAAVLTFGLVAGAGSAAASSNYACPGLLSLEKLTTGTFNVACGFEALYRNTVGSYNVASGPWALHNNTTGSENVASGSGALYSNLEGSYNVASGTDALDSNTRGNDNVASGPYALINNTEGSFNVASGPWALESNKTGSYNVASGRGALVNNTEGSFNVALGFEAGEYTRGSGNIDISNKGVYGDSGTTRIGSEGAQTWTFVSGIYPTALTGCFVQVTPGGQLGCNKNAAAEGPQGKEGKEGREGKPGAEGKEGPEGKPGAEGKEGKPGAEGEPGAEGKEGPQGKEGKEGPPVSTKGLKICVQQKAGGVIKLPPCKKGFAEKTVAEL